MKNFSIPADLFTHFLHINAIKEAISKTNNKKKKNKNSCLVKEKGRGLGPY